MGRPPLAKVSGITHGGITYHYPTKEDLLRGLLGLIRTYTSQDESHRRFLCGMLSAATLDPSLMDSCRQELSRCSRCRPLPGRGSLP